MGMGMGSRQTTFVALGDGGELDVIDQALKAAARHARQHRRGGTEQLYRMIKLAQAELDKLRPKGGQR